MKPNIGKLRSGWFHLFNDLMMLLFVFACVYPFYYILIYSLSDPALATQGITFFPRGFSLKLYYRVMRLNDIGSAYLVSTARTVLGTLLTVVCTSLLAFLFTQNDLPLRKFFYRTFIATMYVSGGLIPWYLVMRAYGFKDNFLLYIIPSAVSVYYMILMKTFMEQLPPSLEESARLDGAGLLVIYAHIIFPLSTPILATIAVFSAVGQWNSWQDNFFLVLNPKLQTVQYMLYNYIKSASYAANNLSALEMTDLAQKQTARISPDAVRMAVTFITTLPILLVYPFMQRYFIKGMMMGAIKG